MPVGEGGSLLTAKLDSNPQCSEEVGETLESSSGNNPIILDFGGFRTLGPGVTWSVPQGSFDY